MTGEETLVWSDELGLSCRRSLLPGDGGCLRRTTQHTAAADEWSGAGNPGSLLQEPVEMLQHLCRVLWKLVEMSFGPRYLTAGLCQWWYSFSSEAPGNSLPPLFL